MSSNFYKQQFDPNKPFLSGINPTNSKYYVPPPQFYKSTHTAAAPSPLGGASTYKKIEKKIKYKYCDDEGNRLSAGGILLFDETTKGKGIWVIKEEENGAYVYTDFGGKYDHNDGDIIATITREFREESYNTCEIPYLELIKVPKSHYVYINGYDGHPSYICVAVHINQFNISFDNEEVKNARLRIMKANPNIPSDWYKTLEVQFILLKDISSGKEKISFRLEAVLRELKNEHKKYDAEVNAFFK